MSVGEPLWARLRGTPWQNENVTTEYTWLTLTELAERTGLARGRVRRLIEDHALPAVRREGQLMVADAFLDGDGPRNDVAGTFTLLLDAGFENDEAVEWMLQDDPSLGTSPIAALTAGRKAEVRRVAQALA